MKHGIWIGRIPDGQKIAWAHMPFIGRHGLAHHWKRLEDGRTRSACGMTATETYAVGLIQAEGADRCKRCERKEWR